MKQRRSVDFLVIQVRETLDFLNTGIRGRVKAHLLWLVVATILIGALAGFIEAGASFAQVEVPATIPTPGGLIWSIQCVDCSRLLRVPTDRSLLLDKNNRPHIAYGGDFLYYAWQDGTAWHVETVDKSPGSGICASLALDAAGNPHISYAAPYDGLVKYAHWVGNRWNIQVVDDNFGSATSLALDSSGTPHISYFDEWSGDLRYAHLVGNTWTVQVLDSRGIGNGSHGGATSIAVDNVGTPHISYYDDVNNHLKFAHWTSGTWITQTVDNTQYSGTSSSLSLDGAGYPHIGYTSSEGMKYARWTGNAWAFDLIDSTGDGYPSLSLDSLGHPHVGYRGESGLQYARWTGSQWITQTVEADGSNVALALSSDDVPHISYLAEGGAKLKYALWTGAAWDIQTVDRGGSAGTGNSLALDHDGGPHISYLDDNHVRYASWTDGNWTIQTVDQVRSYQTTQTTLALDDSGKPHIGYNDRENEDVRYAYWNGNRWVTETVQTEVGHDTMPSLAVSGWGGPAMTYLGRYGDLTYAVRQSSGSWWTEVVRADWGAPAEWGAVSSLAIDKVGRPHISYSAGYVKYARRLPINSQWEIQIVDYDATPDQTSLALDSAGNPHISYRDDENDVVKYARWNGSEWLLQTVDSALQGRTPLALDSNDNPVICYRGISGQIRCARWNGSIWDIRRLDGGGRSFSLALDNADNPRLSFFDSRTADLKYAAGSKPAAWLYLPLTLRDAVLTR